MPSHKVLYTNNEEIIKDPKIKSRFKEEINKYNSFFGETEKIKRFELVADEWTIQNGLLTPTLKVKRNHAIEKYKELIDKMFE